MNWWLPHKFEEKRNFLMQRAALQSAIRTYFAGQGFVEVTTPVLQVCPVMDAHIHGFATTLKGVDLRDKGTLYLQTSPEFDMKKLLVAGMPRIFQLCPVFRNAEGSRLHSPEFTMLEWYRTHSDYNDIMQDTIELIRHCANALNVGILRHKDMVCDPFKEVQKLSVNDAFIEMAGIQLDAYLDDTDAFSGAIKAQGIRVADDDRWDDLFFRVMAEKIEPYLGMDVPTILYDYPVCMASLSRRKPVDPRFAERFELYVCGIELANAFSELTDAKEQVSRYHQEMDIKEQLYGERYPLDEEFIAALEHGLPESGGIALGVDRLAMLMSGAETIDQVLWTSNFGTKS